MGLHEGEEWVRVLTRKGAKTKRLCGFCFNWKGEIKHGFSSEGL